VDVMRGRLLRRHPKVRIRGESSAGSPLARRCYPYICSGAAGTPLLCLKFAAPGLVKAMYRDQGEPEVADLGEHAVQRGLVGERAGHDRMPAVVLDLQVSEPGRPAGVEDPANPDLVASGRSWTAHACVLLRARPSVTSPRRGAVIAVPPVVAMSVRHPQRYERRGARRVTRTCHKGGILPCGHRR
jgi:hypothetical protein